MEKRKVFAVIMSAILALSLTACGAVTVTTAQPEPQPAAEVETPTPTPVEEPEVTPEPTKEPEVEEVVEEPATEEPEVEESTEELEITVEEPKEMTPMEALLNSNMSEYISDVVFDANKFAKDTEAPNWWLGAYDNPIYGNLVLCYKDWYIQLGSDEERPDTNFIMVGTGDWLSGSFSDDIVYSYIFSSGNDVVIKDEKTEIAVSAECIIHLKDICDSVSKNGLSLAPDAVGTDFKLCDRNDYSIQY